MINENVIVVDFSFWQDNDNTPYKIDFTKTWANGADGCILRAGQGSWLDEDFVDYCANADKANFPRGAYWFYDSRTPPEVQAVLFADLISKVGFPQLGLWGDYEETYRGSYGGEKNFKIFIDTLKNKFPDMIIGIYTGPSYWRENTTSTGRAYFSQFPLWIANYGVGKPDIPPDWLKELMWQYTDDGDGYAFGAESSRCDISIFNGTLEEYKSYFSLKNYEPAPEHTGDGMKIYKVKSTAIPYINLRDVPEGSDIGDVYPNTEFQVDKEELDSQGRVWLHSVQTGMVGWVASWLCDFVSDVPTTDCPKHTVEVIIDGVTVFKQEF